MEKCPHLQYLDAQQILEKLIHFFPRPSLLSLKAKDLWLICNIPLLGIRLYGDSMNNKMAER